MVKCKVFSCFLPSSFLPSAYAYLGDPSNDLSSSPFLLLFHFEYLAAGRGRRRRRKRKRRGASSAEIGIVISRHTAPPPFQYVLSSSTSSVVCLSPCVSVWIHFIDSVQLFLLRQAKYFLTKKWSQVLYIHIVILLNESKRCWMSANNQSIFGDGWREQGQLHEREGT